MSEEIAVARPVVDDRESDLHIATVDDPARRDWSVEADTPAGSLRVKRGVFPSPVLIQQNN